MPRSKALFTDEDLFEVTLPSQRKGRAEPTEASTQTVPILAADAETSTVGVAEAAVQTEQGGRHEAGTGIDGPDGAEGKDGESDSAAHSKVEAKAEAKGADAGILEGVARMLQRVGPTMEQELSGAATSTALDGYPPPPPAMLLGLGGGGDGAAALGRAWHHCSLGVPQTGWGSRQGLQCTGVDWNASGSVLVASFGRVDLEGWCEVPGLLCAWSLFRRDFDSNNTPEVVVEHSSCLLAVAAHPTNPSIVAAGSHNGEVLVVDLSRALGSGSGAVETKDDAGPGGGSEDGPVLFCSRVDDYLHRDPVRGVQWVGDGKKRGGGHHLLASVSCDGKVLFWDPFKHGLRHPVKGQRLQLVQAVSAAEASGGRGGRDEDGGLRGLRLNHEKAVHGGTCVAFVGAAEGGGQGGGGKGSIRTAVLLVGSEAGALLSWPPPPASALGAASAFAGSDSGVPWDLEARELVGHVLDASARRAVAAHVEKWARENPALHAPGRAIDPRAVLLAKPDPNLLFNGDASAALGGGGSGGARGPTRFTPHGGPVLGLGASPFHRSLFSSCGADGSLRVSSLLQAKPLFELEPNAGGAPGGVPPPLFDVKWSRTRPLVLAAASAAGKVLVFDLGVSASLPVAELAAPKADQESSQAVLCGGANGAQALSVAFNPKMRAFLAFGDADGKVHVFRCPASIADAQAGEEAKLAKIVGGLAEGGAEEAAGKEPGGDGP